MKFLQDLEDAKAKRKVSYLYNLCFQGILQLCGSSSFWVASPEMHTTLYDKSRHF